MRGREFAEWRVRCGLSQAKVAEIGRVNRSTVSEIETNDLPVAPEWCEAIVEHLNENARSAQKGLA